MNALRVLNASNVALICTLVFLPFLIYQAAQLKFGTAFVEAWLPGDDLAKSNYREFRKNFGDDQFLIVSWPGCELNDPRLEVFSAAIEELAEKETELGIFRVGNSAQAIRDLTGTLSYIAAEDRRLAVALSRLEGFAIGKDLSAFIVLRLRQESVERHAKLFEEIESIAQRVLGPEADELILAGEPYQIYVIDRSSRAAMQYYVAPSSILALLVAWVCLRELKLTVLVFVFAGIGQLIGMAAISFFLEEMIAVLVVLPTLVFMLTLSAAVHLTNYYVDLRGERDRDDQAGCGQGGCGQGGCGQGGGRHRGTGSDSVFASRDRMEGVRALRVGVAPCVLATATTVFGFASLVTSELAPVWQFGVLSALSLVAASALMLVNFPATARGLERLFGARGRASTRIIDERSASEKATSFNANRTTETSTQDRFTEWLSRLTGRHATSISLMGVAGLILAAVGISRMQSSTEFEDMFPADSAALRSLYWVRDHIGPLHSLEVLVRCEDVGSDPNLNSDTELNSASNIAAGLELTRELSILQQLSHRLREVEQVDSTSSAVTFLPEIPDGRGARSTVQRAILRRKVAEQLPTLAERGLLHTEGTQRTWRITARIENLRGDNYQSVKDRLLDNLRSTTQRLESLQPGLRIDYQLAGIRTVVEKAHHALIRDLATSFATAFVLITPVMMLIVRGFWSGLVLMIPNVLPVALVFGSMGWVGVQLDVASILTASVALGIAVDDTLHFVTWFFRARRVGHDARESVRRAIAVCARPMLHTTLICTCAMAPFFLSDFLPTSKFALLMILILWGAILGDLLVLPSLLQSPLGNWIGAKQAASAKERAGEEVLGAAIIAEASVEANAESSTEPGVGHSR